MNLSTLLTTLAFVTAAEAKLGGTPSFPEQVSFLEAPCEGCAPKYCYPQYADPDNKCYKDGFPKCCSKSKGNCPNHNKPGCECLPGTCGGSGGDKKTLGVRCTRGDGTCKGSTFCKTTEGTCAGGGRCEDMTTSCDRSMKQVCGCNGATYDNECAAFGVGVSVDYDRACGSPPVEDDNCTLDGNQCGQGQFCAADEGQCLLKMARIPGQCRPRRSACDMSYNPVCGCNGETYDNANCAQARGVNVASEGACAASNSCTYYGANDDTCSANNSFCRIGKGDCRRRIASQKGSCGIKPNTCTNDYQPVCGCDSTTYSNECAARFEGVNIMHNGQC